MTVKKTLENRIRGWFPQQPKTSEVPAQIGFKPLQPKPKIDKSYILGIVGGIVLVLIACLQLFLGLVFSGSLKFLDIFQTGEPFPTQIAMQYYSLATVGFVAAAIGFIGVALRSRQGSIMLIVAGAIAGIALNILGAIPCVLMVISGGLELGKQPAPTKKQILSGNKIPGGMVRAAKVLIFYGILYIALYLLFEAFFLSLAPLAIVVGVVSGVLFGALNENWASKRILKQLEKQNVYKFRWKDYFLFITPYIIAVFLFLLIGFVLVGFTSISILLAFMTFNFSFFATWYIVRAFLFSSFEKTKKTFVLQKNWLESKDYYLFPQTSNNSSNILPQSNPPLNISSIENAYLRG
jgi:hypothetical protein